MLPVPSPHTVSGMAWMSQAFPFAFLSNSVPFDVNANKLSVQERQLARGDVALRREQLPYTSEPTWWCPTMLVSWAEPELGTKPWSRAGRGS